MNWLTRWISSPTVSALDSLREEEITDNGIMLQFFTWHSKHDSSSWWKHLELEIPEIARMGFTKVWIPPPTKAASGNTSCGYDVYDLWDLGEFEQKGGIGTRWGTKKELLQACQVARRHGVDIIIDAVLNHRMGADRTETFQAVPVNPDNRLQDTGRARPIQGWTAFDFAGRSGKYSDLRWTHEHFTGIDWDHKTRSKTIYRMAGKRWSELVSQELGNYDYLMGADVDHRHPDVQKDLFAWVTWVLETTGSTGLRLDAIKHIDRRFLFKFIESAKSQAEKQIFVVSELWSANLKSFEPYIRSLKGQTAFFDVPLHMNFYQASISGPGYDLRKLLKHTVYSFKPREAVTFVDNHDTMKGQSLESWVEQNFKVHAYAIILLHGQGFPCVFYGDLYPNPECYDAHTSHHLKRLVRARKLYAYGNTLSYSDGKNCIGFVRMGITQRSSTGVDNTVHSIRMNVGKKRALTKYCSYLSEGYEVQINADGWGEFTCPASFVQVWVPSLV